ncbi:hypothetical protein EXA19_18375 [Vibrio cincinnatiensis]|nr:hypothetical protein [Vibrio cincinnatiensis]
MQEYLKSIREMVYHERTYTGSQTSKFSEKTRLSKVGFFTSGVYVITTIPLQQALSKFWGALLVIC